jgi:hypothetical protein
MHSMMFLNSFISITTLQSTTDKLWGQRRGWGLWSWCERYGNRLIKLRSYLILSYITSVKHKTSNSLLQPRQAHGRLQYESIVKKVGCRLGLYNDRLPCNEWRLEQRHAYPYVVWLSAQTTRSEPKCYRASMWRFAEDSIKHAKP